MAFTGMQRSLTVTINKMVAGVQVEGYPRIYYGRKQFTYNGVNYPEIDVSRMATMPVDRFNERLSAFKSYVESLEIGLSFNDDTIAGSDAYQQNLDVCPIN